MDGSLYAGVQEVFPVAYRISNAVALKFSYIGKMYFLRCLEFLLYVALAVFFIYSGIEILISPNGIDFLEYWGANKLRLTGQNPYDAVQLLTIQGTIEPHRVEPIMMWNPPHTLSLLSPILNLSYENALLTWRLTGVVVYFFLAIKAFGGFSSDIDLKGLLVALGFSPFLLVLHMGQIAIYMALGVYFIYHGLFNKKILYVIGGFILLSIKPHLFIIFGMLVFLSLYFNRDWPRLKIILHGLLFFSVLLGAHILLNPLLYNDWWKALFDSKSTGHVVPHAVNWISHSFVSAFIHHMPLGMPTWYSGKLIYIIILLLIFSYFLIRKPQIDIFKNFLPFMILSVSLAPLCWATDSVVWSYPFFIWVLHCTRQMKQKGSLLVWGLHIDARFFIWILLILNLWGYLAINTVYDYWAMTFLFPLAILILWIAINLKKRNLSLEG